MISFLFWAGGYLLRIIWNWSKGNGMGESEKNNKHCKRHDGPRGWVLSSKYLHQVISQVDQNSKSHQTSASKSWQYLALKALTKIKVQILYQTSASKSWPNCRQHSFNISNTNNLNATQVKSVIYFNNSSQLVFFCLGTFFFSRHFFFVSAVS